MFFENRFFGGSKSSFNYKYLRSAQGSAGEKQAKQIWVGLFELDLMQTNHIIHLATAPKLASFSFPPAKFQFREGKKKKEEKISFICLKFSQSL